MQIAQTTSDSLSDSANSHYSSFSPFFKNLVLPEPNSHKGQNGKLMIIGGSELFHAASKWSLDVASKFVDMVFYASVPSNNELILQAKQAFWNGIVVSREDMHAYIEESDVILIGPGMDRSSETQKLADELVQNYPTKKWVIDAGALQMIDPTTIPATAILTPHHRELEMLQEKGFDMKQAVLAGITVLVKGATDEIHFRNESGVHETMMVAGGNAGMTKGGTGDVLAGLVGALYATQDSVTATVVGSVTNKAAGDSLYEKVGPYFNASDLVDEVPKVLWELAKSV